MQAVEVILFIVAVVGVIALGIWKAKKDESKSEAGGEAADYFLAGRGLTWWLVGFSLIAANISTEQFVGMSGSAADWLGMAIASYEWIAAVTLVLVAFFFLPRFLKSGLYTIPEFLQYRFDGTARLAMAIPAIVTLVFVTTSSVIFSGAKFVSEYYNDVPVISNLTAMCWAIAALAAVYVFVGGLKACAWTDLIWGGALILGGAIVMWFAFSTLADKPAEELILTKVENSDATAADIESAGAWERFMLLNDGKNGEAVARNGDNLSGGKVHMVRPKEDSDIPWTALLVGLWIPNFFYWGLNQYIVQRTLGSKSLAEGQKGIVFAAALKLIIPFIVVIPGILAFNLFSGDLRSSAMAKNETFLADAKPGDYFTVQEKFVELEPEHARAAFVTNATLLGTPNLVMEGVTPAEKAAEINGLAAKLDEQKKKDKDSTLGSSSTLKAYDYDAAFPVLVRNLISPMPWISWFVLAALCGAVISSLASMLNSASTIATMDLYSNFTGNKDSDHLVKVGRIFVVLFVILAALLAPKLDNFTSIFAYIQEFQGFISPGILAVFILGFFSPRTPRFFGVVGIVTNVVAYGALKWFIGPVLTKNGLWYSEEMAFLDRMAICFFLVLIVGGVLTKLRPLAHPVEMPENKVIALESSKGAKMVGIGVIVATIALYAIFW
ncbi:sodium:solute symporter family transporter [Roseibacillus ishigakijimensis]|uniref:Sodium/solute symporter n=1 Tax=Roseibacillus ishigakijimensis TaxID=454146 RepID=A0A934RS00_9BACT|nr:sodium/solute symporter [Roseibacillus ishigakijimensis]MBK1834852.1 sodium/solute symporter [Roseibacillus ishigakijimensis]